MAKPKKVTPPSGMQSVQTSNNTKVITISVIVAVLLALIAIAFALSQNEETDDATKDLMQFQPVKVIGQALPGEYADENRQQAIDATGKVAPEIEGSAFDSQPFNIKKNGKAKYLMFFQHSCIHCNKELPEIARWLPDNRSKYGNVEFIAISTGANPNAPNYPPSAWFKKKKWTDSVLVDDNKLSIANAYGLSAYPYFVTLDPDMRVLSRGSGERSIEAVAASAQQAQDSTKR